MIFCKPKYDGGFKMSEYLPEGKLISEQENINILHSLKMLEDADVKPIEALGGEFNPDFHNAVMHVEDDSVGENIVVEEFEKGYTYRDQVIRHSMVKVAN